MGLQNKTLVVIGLRSCKPIVAVEFGKYNEVIGSGIGPAAMDRLRSGLDRTFPGSRALLQQARAPHIRAKDSDLTVSQVFNVATPRPGDRPRKVFARAADRVCVPALRLAAAVGRL